MDPTLTADSQSLNAALGVDPTSLYSGGAVVGTNGSPSTGLDLNGLFSQLLGNATSAYNTTQLAQQPNVIIPPNYAPSTPGVINIGGYSLSTTSLFFIGAGVLAFALVLRR